MKVKVKPVTLIAGTIITSWTALIALIATAVMHPPLATPIHTIALTVTTGILATSTIGYIGILLTEKAART